MAITNEKPGPLRSMLWAVPITAFLCAWGAGASLALVHGGGPLVLLFLPVIPVILLFGSGGPFSSVPEWAFNSLAIGSEFIWVFFVIHLVRYLRWRKRSAV